MKRLIAAWLLACSLVLAPAASAQGPVASRQAVVATADPRATEAGAEILRAGGNATDAAIAMMLALTVVEPQSSGIGGGGFLVHYSAESGVTRTIDGRETAPAAAGPDRFFGPDGKPLHFLSAFPGGKSVGVPGNIKLAAMAHERWGSLEWQALFQPAIRLAEQGFAVTRPLHAAIVSSSTGWRDFPAIRALYLDAAGKPLAEGATLRNPALGKLLRDIADAGPDAFYTGAHAQALVDAVTGSPVNPSDMTLTDLASYQAVERDAVCGEYRVYTICGMAPPSSGGVTVIQILTMLERFDIKAMGAQSPLAWHLLGQSMRLAYADRDTWLADADFVDVPLTGLIDRAYLDTRSKLILTDSTPAGFDPGTPPGAPARIRAEPGEAAGTTHFVAVDKGGDVVSYTSTVEGPFGSQLIASGMVLNNELTDFSIAPEAGGYLVANRVEGGKRPLSSMSPTIVFDASGKPILAVGSAGGRRIIMHVAKTLVGVLDFGLSAADALALPNLYFDANGLLIENDAAGKALLPGLAALGTVREAPVGSKLTAIERTDAGWRGAADPRSVGTAITVP